MKPGFFLVSVLLLLYSSNASAQSADTMKSALKEVVVNATRVQRVLRSAIETVVDFDILDDSTLLVASYRGNNGDKAHILLLHASGQILSSADIPYEPVSLVKSCVGKYYYVSTDSFTLLNTDGGSISLGKSYPVRLLAPLQECRIAGNNYFYYRNTDRNFFRTTFSYASAGSSQSTCFLRLEDVHTADASLEEYMEIQNLLSKGNYKLAAVKNNNRNFWDKEALLKISGDIYRTDTCLLVFDMFSKLMRFYSFNGTPLRTVPIQFGWTSIKKLGIIKDEQTGNFYLHRFDNSAAQTIEEIDLHSGSTGTAIKLEKPFVTKVRIYNGRLYYLYKNPKYLMIEQLYMQIF